MGDSDIRIVGEFSDLDASMLEHELDDCRSMLSEIDCFGALQFGVNYDSDHLYKGKRGIELVLNPLKPRDDENKELDDVLTRYSGLYGVNLKPQVSLGSFLYLRHGSDGEFHYEYQGRSWVVEPESLSQVFSRLFHILDEVHQKDMFLPGDSKPYPLTCSIYTGPLERISGPEIYVPKALFYGSCATEVLREQFLDRDSDKGFSVPDISVFG